MKTLTIDASVFLNGFNPYENGHEISREFLFQIHSKGTPIIVPTLLLPEVAAAISRGRDDAGLAREFAVALERLSHVIWVPLDEILSRHAVNIAAQYRLRGSDAVYAAVAQRFGSVLVSLDREQLERVSDVVMTRNPSEIRLFEKCCGRASSPETSQPN